MLIIDSHAHLYGEDEARYPPIKSPNRPPNGKGYFSNLKRVMSDNNVAGVCVIQPGTFYMWDNRFICDVSRAEPKKTAAVCSLNPDDSRSPKLLKNYVNYFGVRGMRSYPAADGRVDHPGVRDLWQACQDAEIVVNVFVNRDKSDELSHMLELFPNLPVVIDHCLNLKAGPEMESTLSDLIRLARFANTYAKLSFLPTGSNESYPFRDMHETCHKIIESFGAGRCVWGSNFPS